MGLKTAIADGKDANGNGGKTIYIVLIVDGGKGRLYFARPEMRHFVVAEVVRLRVELTLHAARDAAGYLVTVRTSPTNTPRISTRDTGYSIAVS